MRITLGLLAFCLMGLTQTADGRDALAKGRTITGYLKVEATWVFCDEDELGAFVIGDEEGRRLWVKVRVADRWTVAKHVKPGSRVRFEGKVDKPRGGGTQLVAGRILAVDDKVLGLMGRHTDYTSIRDTVFNMKLTEAARVDHWRRLEGKPFTDVGRIIDLSADRKTMEVKFQDGAWKRQGRVRLTSPISQFAVGRYARDAYVMIGGKIHDYWFKDKAIDITEATVALVPEKQGRWVGNELSAPRATGAWRSSRHGEVPPWGSYAHAYFINEVFKGHKRKLWDRVGGGPFSAGDEVWVSFFDVAAPPSKGAGVTRFWIGADTNLLWFDGARPVKLSRVDEGMPPAVHFSVGAISKGGGKISRMTDKKRAPTRVTIMADGEPVHFTLADKKRFHFHLDDAPKRKGYKEEQLTWVMDTARFLRLVKAKSLEIRIRNVVVPLTSAHRELLRDFASKLLWPEGRR